jgi:hypothetical protein
MCVYRITTVIHVALNYVLSYQPGAVRSGGCLRVAQGPPLTSRLISHFLLHPIFFPQLKISVFIVGHSSFSSLGSGAEQRQLPYVIATGFTILHRSEGWIKLKLKTKLRGLSPRANYTDRSTAAC